MVADDNKPLAKGYGQRTTRRKRIEKAAAGTTMSSSQRRIHWCLCLLMAIVLFEGLARKMAPKSMGILIFFFKDVLTLILLLLCMAGKTNSDTKQWLKLMGTLLLLLLPCIITTAVNDPVLAVFGAKQYILFPTVAVAMCAAYLPNHQRQLFTLFRWLALSVVITTLVAVAQNRLPTDHWLNLSVAGEELGDFSAGGYLRVASTFSFVGQYGYYLNALCYCLPVFYLTKSFRKLTATFIMVALVGLFLVGTFVTGSRGSVIGNTAILTAGGLLAVACGGGRGWIKIVAALIVGAILLGVLKSQYPELFGAYEARVEGTDEVSHNIEIKKRVERGLLDWTEGSAQAPPSFLGYGLGVMSNGSDKLSAYAARWRAGFWTETDQATTFFEGGWYLVLVWYGFRFWVILHCFGLVLKLRRADHRLMACFAWGFILIVGVTGTLALQPPMAIWWWLAVGLILSLRRFDRNPLEGKTSTKPAPGPRQRPEAEHPFIVTH